MTNMARLLTTISRGYLAHDDNPEVFLLEVINIVSAIKGKEDTRQLARMLALGGEEDMTNV